MADEASQAGVADEARQTRIPAGTSADAGALAASEAKCARYCEQVSTLTGHVERLVQEVELLRRGQHRVENARTAANVSLKNKSIEMSATFHKKLLEKVAELNEGGSSLLTEAQERHDELTKQLQEEKLRHETAKEQV